MQGKMIQWRGSGSDAQCSKTKAASCVPNQRGHLMMTLSGRTCIHDPGGLVDAGPVIVSTTHMVRHDGGGAAFTDAHLEPGEMNDR